MKLRSKYETHHRTQQLPKRRGFPAQVGRRSKRLLRCHGVGDLLPTLVRRVSIQIYRYATFTHPGAESKARGILSIGAFHQEADEGPSPLIPRLYLRSSESTTSEPKTTTVEVLIPFVGVDIGKPALDSLQLWADDVTQWMERALGDDRAPADSRATSIIGSRYFEHRTASVVESEASGRQEQRSEFAIKLVVSEGVNVST